MALQKQATFSIRSVMLATDFLSSSRLALDYAVALARHFQAELMLFNAFEFGPHSENVEILDHIPSRERRDAETRLAAFAADVERLGIKTTWRVTEGPVASTILKAAHEQKPDMLVLGTQGIHRGLSHLLIGSNTETIMLGSSCPTLTIGPHVHGGIGPNLSFRRIIYISDFSAESTAAASYAAALSRALSIDVELYQVKPASEDQDEDSRLQETALAYCDALKSRPDIDPKWLSVEFQLSRIRRAEELMSLSLDTFALIVLGVQPETYLERHLHTSFAYRLLASASCPIVTIPNRPQPSIDLGKGA